MCRIWCSALQAELEGLTHALHHMLKEKIYHVQSFVDCKVIAQFLEDPLSDVEVEIPHFPWFDRLRPLCKNLVSKWLASLAILISKLIGQQGLRCIICSTIPLLLHSNFLFIKSFVCLLKKKERFYHLVWPQGMTSVITLLSVCT